MRAGPRDSPSGASAHRRIRHCDGCAGRVRLPAGPHRDAYSHSHRDAYSYFYRDAYSHAYRDAYSYSHRDAYSYSYRDAYSYSYLRPYADGAAYGDLSRSRAVRQDA